MFYVNAESHTVRESNSLPGWCWQSVPDRIVPAMFSFDLKIERKKQQLNFKRNFRFYLFDTTTKNRWGSTGNRITTTIITLSFWWWCMGCNREIIHHHTVGLCSLVQSDGLDWGVLIALLSQESLAMAICTNVCGLEHIVGSNCDSSGLVRFWWN